MEDTAAVIANTSPNPATCWSSIVKTPPAPKPQKQFATATSQVLMESCKSSKGIAVAVVDANAVIQGGEKLAALADKFVSVPEVLDEVRDPTSRHRLAFLPFSIEPVEPSAEALNKVIKFARATGDLQTLSDVDLKLIALTYTLEAQIHGTNHLRDCPPPVHTLNVKRLPEKEMPGWGSNVPNLEEWEALEQETEDPSKSNSRILPLRDLNLNIVPADAHSENGSLDHTGPQSENQDGVCTSNQDDVGISSRNPRRYPPKKREINIEGKKMVADGVDASQGQFDDNSGDWMPAVSRSTHRRYLRRKARRDFYEASSKRDGQQDHQDSETVMGDSIKDAGDSSKPQNEDTGIINVDDSQIAEENENLSEILEQMRLEEDSLNTLREGHEVGSFAEPESDGNKMEDATSDGNANMNVEGSEGAIGNEELDQPEISSQMNESVETSFKDDDSEQSWTLRSLSESSIACITSDFAMQNVILQMGLRLLAPGGMQIRQLHRWILKCHACYTVTSEIGRIFCPKCGNGGTLRKVAVTVGENGIVLAAHKPRITLRGTKFSLPLPQGGRDAITKNLILREDQLPQKFLHPKTKKKANKQEDDFFTPDSIFIHHTDKRAPLQPPVRKAMAVFSGKRNPNDNHYSRSKQR